MKGRLKTVLFVVVVSLGTGCNRTDDPIVITDPFGGKGGSTVLKLTPKHHNQEIDSSMVYIKYNASDIPLSYDDSAKCVHEGGKPVATFTNLKKGKYYLFGKGYDQGLPVDASSWFNVKGGMSYEIKQDSTTLELTLPVTEVH